MSKNSRIALIAGSVLVALLVLVPVIVAAVTGGWYGRSGYWGMMGPGMMGFGGGMMFIPMIIFWGLIIWGIVALVRYFSGTRSYAGHTDSALDMLKSRYAKGEIDKQEYEEKKKDLI